MQLIRFENPADFANVVRDFLMQDEAVNNLLLSLTRRMADRDPNPESYMALVEHQKKVLVIAFRQPPRQLLLSKATSLDAMPLLVEDVCKVYDDLSHFNGPSASSAAYREAWQAHTGQSSEIDMRQRIYKLETLIPVEGVPGSMRRATDDDLLLLTDWMLNFINEAVPSDAEEDAPAQAARAINGYLNARDDVAGLFIWEVDGQPVAMTGHTGPTPNGMRVNAVYTPQAHRRNGYASALTAAVSEHVLGMGKRFCFLYTDLDNPTSNSIYQKIGYNPVTDVDQYRIIVE